MASNSNLQLHAEGVQAVIWEAFLATYLLMGLLFSWMSGKGHKVLYGTPLPWHGWVAGTIGWPIAFIIGGRKR